MQPAATSQIFTRREIAVRQRAAFDIFPRGGIARVVHDDDAIQSDRAFFERSE